VIAEGLCSTHTHTQHGESRDVNQGSLNKRQGLYENNPTVKLYLFVTVNKLCYCIQTPFVLFDGSCVKREIFDASDLVMKEHSPSWEADASSEGQEIPRILRNPKVRYLPHNTEPIFPTLINTNPFHALPSFTLKAYSNIISHLRWVLPSGLFPSGFPTKTFACIPPLPLLPHAPPVLSSVFDNSIKLGVSLCHS